MADAGRRTPPIAFSMFLRAKSAFSLDNLTVLYHHPPSICPLGRGETAMADAGRCTPPARFSVPGRAASDGPPVMRRKVDVRLPGKGNSNSHGARPVHLGPPGMCVREREGRWRLGVVQRFGARDIWLERAGTRGQKERTPGGAETGRRRLGGGILCVVIGTAIKSGVASRFDICCLFKGLQMSTSAACSRGGAPDVVIIPNGSW